MNSKSFKYLKFYNNFGAFTSDEIKIHNYKRIIPLRLQSIRKIQLVKRRKLNYNVLFLSISLLIFWTVAFNDDFLTNQIALFSLGITFFITSVIYRSFELKLIIVMKFDFITLEVKRALELETIKFIAAFDKYHNDLQD